MTLTEQIHDTPTKAVLIITGGGTEVLPMLLKRGGGSATLLSAVVPYCEAESAQLLGAMPEKMVSEQTTRQLAMAAYQKALALSDGKTPVIGVTSSSALQKTPEEREGRVHHIFAALQTGMRTVSLSLTIDPAKLTWEWHHQPIKPTAYDIREWEEEVNARMILRLVAEGCGVRSDETQGPIHKDLVRRESTIYCGYFPDLLAGKVKALVYTPGEGVWLPLDHGIDEVKFLLPGSFNPAHPAHNEMAEYVEKATGCYRVDYELSIRNADKPLLDFITLEERLATVGNRRVWITNAPTFVAKAQTFPGISFLVGYDTAVRILNPKYAGDIDSVLSVFESTNVRFVVFGREINGVYHAGLDGLPKRFTDLCTEVIEPLHFCSVSSTGIRSAEK